MTPTFTHDQVRAWRMARNLDFSGSIDAVAVTSRLCGVQAQVTSSAEEAVVVRGAPPGDVAAALDKRALIRTWAQRGTLHLLVADEAPAYLALLAHARSWEKGAWQRRFASAAQIAELVEAASVVLDGACLTRAELVEAVVSETGDDSLREALESGWGALLKPLAWQGVLCNGPAESGVTFTSPASFVPGWSGLPDVSDAAPTVIGAYLGCHGPATPDAFDQWLLRGATPKKVLRGWFADLAEAGTIELVDVEGDERYARTADLDDLADAKPTGRIALLPAFDQLLLGPGTADPEVIAADHRKSVSKAAGWIAPIIVRDGRVVGTWSRADDGTITKDLFPL